MIEITLIPVLNDNYAYLIEGENGLCAIVDPGEAAPILKVLKAKGLSLDFVLNTHHHGDHIHGNDEIITRYGAKLVAPASEATRIQGIGIALSEGDVFEFGDESFEIFETPGHTRGHICFYGRESHTLFSGDTLFAMGCGRLFEGNAQDMFTSFQKLTPLPDDTQIYAGHEYTLSNAEFCAHAEPENADIAARLAEIKQMRADDIPTLPTSLVLEKKTNVFLRAKSAEEFGKLRAAKDAF